MICTARGFDAKHGDDEELDTEARECYRERAEAINAGVIQNAKLTYFQVLSARKCVMVEPSEVI